MHYYVGRIAKVTAKYQVCGLRLVETFGVKSPLKFLRNEIDQIESLRKDAKPISLNKVGEYFEGEDGNTTLPC